MWLSPSFCDVHEVSPKGRDGGRFSGQAYGIQRSNSSPRASILSWTRIVMNIAKECHFLTGYSTTYEKIWFNWALKTLIVSALFCKLWRTLLVTYTKLSRNFLNHLYSIRWAAENMQPLKSVFVKETKILFSINVKNPKRNIKSRRSKSHITKIPKIHDFSKSFLN